jgi:hypothetical protein
MILLIAEDYTVELVEHGPTAGWGAPLCRHFPSAVLAITRMFVIQFCITNRRRLACGAHLWIRAGCFLASRPRRGCRRPFGTEQSDRKTALAIIFKARTSRLCRLWRVSGRTPHIGSQPGQDLWAWLSLESQLSFLLLPLPQPHPGPAAVFVDELDAGALQNTRDCCERRCVPCVPPSFDVCNSIAMELGGLRKVSDGPV